jgi:hypothetical protein
MCSAEASSGYVVPDFSGFSVSPHAACTTSTRFLAFEGASILIGRCGASAPMKNASRMELLRCTAMNPPPVGLPAGASGAMSARGCGAEVKPCAHAATAIGGEPAATTRPSETEYLRSRLELRRPILLTKCQPSRTFIGHRAALGPILLTSLAAYCPKYLT